MKKFYESYSNRHAIFWGLFYWSVTGVGKWYQIGSNWAFAVITKGDLTQGGVKWYFRLFGYGLMYSTNKKPTFSERFGYRRVWRYGTRVIEVLRPGR